MTSFPPACLRSGPVRRGRARRGSLLLALLSVFALAACRPPPPVAAVRAAWDWKTFPEGRSLLVAQLPATVGPARSLGFRASEAGRRTLEVAQHAADAEIHVFEHAGIDRHPLGVHPLLIRRQAVPVRHDG